MIDILVGGDVCPSGAILEMFREGNAEGIFGSLRDEIEAADLFIVNLECPLIARQTPILKVGPVLGADEGCVRGLVASRVSALNLANNHIFDHGISGLRETLTAAEKAGLGVVGAGLDLQAAQAPLIRTVKGQRVVIYAMAEREFSIAGRRTPGANPLDLISLVETIRRHKQEGIFIALLHGGAEFYGYPSPGLRRRCRFMIDMGADAVVCCHTHCPLPWELYKDRPIIYGLGNLIFEAPPGSSPEWHKGYLAKLSVRDGRVSFAPIPYDQFKDQPGARKMDPGAGEGFLDDMRIKGDRIKDDAFVESRWAEFCRSKTDSYLAGLFGYNRLMRKLQPLLLRSLHSKKDILRAGHLVQCETHQEVLATIFEDFRRRSDEGKAFFHGRPQIQRPRRPKRVARR